MTRRSHIVAWLIAVVLFSHGGQGARAQAATETGAELYARCAICHQHDARGIPGAFPPLRTQLDALMQSAAGRAYLVLVTTHGLFGELVVDGASYRSAMPAQPLPDAQLAALMNYLRLSFASRGEAIAAFGAREVEGIRAAYPKPASAILHALRAEGLQ